MKKLILILAMLSLAQAVSAECAIQTASQLSSEYVVSPPLDVVKTKSPGKCNVKFKISVNGEMYQADETVEGMLPDEMLCHQAIAQGRSDILVNLGGKYKTEMINSCKEGRSETFVPVKIGEHILENEVAVVDKVQKYFNHKGAKCRLFKEQYGKNGKIVINHGVICQIDHSDTNWIVVDKW